MTLPPCSMSVRVGFHLMLVVGLLSLLCSPVTYSATQSSRHSSYAVISTKLGQVRGRVVQVTSSVTGQAGKGLHVITQFLGVPYALPPIGQLRFQEPKKTNGWMLQGILNTTVPRRRCPVETKRHHRPTEKYFEGQAEWEREDCLYMNIYVPGNLSSTGYTDTMELPVFVIFSEEEQEGSSAQDFKDAFGYLAYYGHIIVIDLSYRSGVLSYLRISGDKLTSGNNGFQDQRLALLWIWDNVREFGGNPEKVTVFGEYQASISLGYHVLQPDSRSLFARAVMHSGTALSQWYLQLDHSAQTLAVAKTVGCVNSTSAVTECIQSVALHKLLKAAEAVELNYTLWSGHMTDPKLVPSQALESLEDGQFNLVDFLIGSSEHDGLCLMQETIEPEILDKVSKASVETLIRNTIKGHYRNANKSEQILQSVVDAVLFEYSSCNMKKNQTKTVAEFLTDMMYRAPAEWTARLTSRQDNSVYLYLVSSKNHSCSSLKSLIRSTENMQKPENQLSKNFIDVLVNFVRKGNPNPLNELDNWRPFTERERYFLHFTDEETHLKQSIRNRKMAFWNDYFPYLLDSDLDSCQPENVLQNSSMDDKVDEDIAKIPLVVCFLVAVGAVLFLLAFLLIRLHHSHHLNSRHRCWCRCCKTWQQPNFHDLIMAAAVSEGEDHKLHPLPYREESAWN